MSKKTIDFKSINSKILRFVGFVLHSSGGNLNFKQLGVKNF